MIRKIRFFLWDLGLITLTTKELGIPNEQDFLKGIGGYPNQKK